MQLFRCYSGIAAFLATAVAMIVGSLLKPLKPERLSQPASCPPWRGGES